MIFIGCTKKKYAIIGFGHARIVQWSGPQPSKLKTRIRIPLRAPKCEIDGTGRRDGLKIRWRDPYRFKSGISHQFFSRKFYVI